MTHSSPLHKTCYTESSPTCSMFIVKLVLNVSRNFESYTSLIVTILTANNVKTKEIKIKNNLVVINTFTHADSIQYEKKFIH